MSLRGLVKVTRIYGKGRTQIPSEIIKALGLEEGDKIAWFMNADGLVYIKVVSPKSKRLGKYEVTAESL